MTEITLPSTILKILKEKASRYGVLIEEYLFDILLNDRSPNESAKEYIKGAKELINQAKEEIKKEI